MKHHRPIYILTGFLGAGKTTLLNRLLKEDHGQRFAVIVNEFGEVGLDGSLISGDEDFVKMDNGCLCCALNDDLVATLESLKERQDYDAVILETTGVADPLPVAWTFFREQFVSDFRFGGIVTVVDVLHLFDMLPKADEVAWQIERADYLYLAKTDVASPDQLESAISKVKEMNGNARLVDANQERLFELLFDVVEPQALPESRSHQHGSAFESVSFDLSGKSIALNDMEDLFEAIPHEVFRAKAIFNDADKTYVMHSVCGRVEFYEVSKPEKLGLVLIGKNLGSADLKVFAKL